jgi:NAD dependent epimerase/dehydratase family enzyme
MKEFAKTLGEVLNRPALFPIPKFAVKILKGELGDYVTDSQRVIPNKLTHSGYNFKFEKLGNALRDLIK